MINIIATPKSASANSYVTLTEADAYCNTLYLAEDWGMLSNDDKCRLIITATTDIDSLPYAYEPASTIQALRLPVLIDNVESGLDIAKKACLLQAWYLYNNVEIVQSAISESIQNIETQSIGKISTNKSSSGFNFLSKYDGTALRLLSPLITMSNRSYRG